MEENKKNSFVKFILNHKLVTTLICIIIILSLYFWVKIRIIENRSIVELSKTEEKAKIVLDSVKNRYDSLLLIGYKQIVEVFKFAVEEDLINNKISPVEEKINLLIQESNIIKIFIVNTDNKNRRESVGKIIFSTDRKDLENLFFDMKMLRNETFVKSEQDYVQAVTPIKDKNTGQITNFLIIQFKK